MPKHTTILPVFLVAAVLLPMQWNALAQSPQKPLGPDEGGIDRLIADLDAPRFETRMTATRRLIREGDQIVPFLESALRNSPSMELQSRGLEVLGRIAQNSILQQEATRRLDGGSAEISLQSLVVGNVGPLAVRAGEKLEELKKHQRRSAIELLMERGAKFADRRLINVSWPNVVKQATFAQDWKGTAEDFEVLKYVDDLQAITLDGPQISADDLHAIRSLHQLTLIEIKHAGVRDSDLALLAGFPNLEYLHIWYTPITDDGVSTLVDIEPQTTLLLYGTKISEKGREQLVAGLPACFVDYRQGAFLGIGGPEMPIPGTTGCVVNKVAPNSAAANAGIMLNDIIISYDGKAVRGFEEIRDLIGQNSAGDRVEVELLRNNQTLKTTVVLREWE